MRIASAEDIILIKLKLFRNGGAISWRQWGDVTRLQRFHGFRLHQEYLQHWSRQRGIYDLLVRLLQEVDALPPR